MNRCYLGLGSNQKGPERQIRQAVKSIRTLPSTQVRKVSKPYWNKAWGVETQQDYCNVVIEVTTILAPSLLLALCKNIERKQGRIKKRHWGPRIIDIDVILYGTRSIKTPKLTIPHPYFLQRDFVVKPLLEINSRALDCFAHIVG
jgi:2-amino-4-hydroxy-6-hydroxymethyldihydropteridine diphosphokinase